MRLALPWKLRGAPGGQFKAAGQDARASGRLPVSTGRSGLSSGGWQVIAFGEGGAAGRDADYRKSAGVPTENSAVAACLQTILTCWPQARPVVVSGAGKTLRQIDDHPAALLLSNPDPGLSMRDLMQAVLWDYFGVGRGNAYLYIVTTASDEPVGLQYLPASEIRAEGDEVTLISRYLYTPAGSRRPIPLPAERVIHWRNGIDPSNPRRGIDPLSSVVPEIATDNEASRWQFALLARGGVPPWILYPRGGEKADPVALDEETVKALKERMQHVLSGKERGAGIVGSVQMGFERLGIAPRDMVMGETQRKSEERISAALGLPAVVAGLGAGLDRATFANYTEARAQAWEDCIIPLQDAFAAAVSLRLMPLFGVDPLSDDMRIAWDRSQIEALQPNRHEEEASAELLYTGGIIDRAEAKRRVGLDPGPEDEGLYSTGQSAPGDGNAPGGNTPAASGSPLPARVLGERPPGEGTGGGVYLPFDPSPAPAIVLRAGEMPQRSLSSLTREFRSSLRGREAAAVTSMSDAYAVARAAIEGRLERLTQSIESAGEAGETISEAWLVRQARYQELMLQIEREMQDLGAQTLPALSAVQREVVGMADAQAPRMAAAAAGKAPAGVTLTWNRLPSAALEAFVGTASDGGPLASLLSSLGQGDAARGIPSLSAQIHDALVAGIATGQNPRQIAEAMRASVESALNLSQTRAETIARTETMRAYREATRQTYEQNPGVVQGWIWTATRDRRTCRGCWAMHGREFPVDQILDDHPNGRCIATPKTPSWAQLTGDESIPDTRPDLGLGADLFDALSDERKQQILGPALFDHFVAGDVILADCVTQTTDPRWGSMRRAATVTEALAHAQERQRNA